jgi:hypothetical protein
MRSFKDLRPALGEIDRRHDNPEIAQACVRLGGLIMLAGELPRTTHADVEIFDQAIPD